MKAGKKSDMPDEKNLVKRCLKNDEKALDELYNRFSSKMFGICLRYTRNKMEAEDLLHDGFIKALNNLQHFRYEGSLEGWLRRLMVNTAINFYRKKSSLSEQDVDLGNIAETAIISEDAISAMSAKELLELIHKLPDGYRTVFNLYVIEGYKHNEIAEMLDISENTSKSQLAKARKYLQNELKKLCYERAI